MSNRMKGKSYRSVISDHFPDKFGLACKDPSLAKQSDRDMFNPNNVMKMFRRTGDMNLFKKRQGFYADISHLSSLSSYADVQAAMAPISDAFYSLASTERAKFGHDPMRFLDFAKDPANLKWLFDEGFLKPSDLGETKSSSSPTQGTSDVKSETVVAP